LHKQSPSGFGRSDRENEITWISISYNRVIDRSRENFRGDVSAVHREISRREDVFSKST